MNASSAWDSSTALQLLAVGGDAIAARDRSAGAASARGGVVAVATLGAFDATTAPEPPAAGAPQESRESFPPSHLLSLPIRVPPGLFAKRWILFYTSDNPPGGCIGSMVFGYTTSDGKHQRVGLSFKASASPWQSTACGTSATARSY